jgi:hypothetical protein
VTTAVEIGLAAALFESVACGAAAVRTGEVEVLVAAEAATASSAK